jgi:hypothetical protein
MLDRAEDRSALQIDEAIRLFLSEPPELSPDFRRMRRRARLPGFVRDCLDWASLNLSAGWRAWESGTFGVDACSALAAPPAPGMTLAYGPVSPQGAIDVRFLYDGRVMGVSTAARGLARLEEILRTRLRDETLGAGAA